MKKFPVPLPMKRHRVHVGRMVSMPHKGTYRYLMSDRLLLKVSNLMLKLKEFCQNNDTVFIQVTPEGAEQLKSLLILYELPYAVFDYPIIKSNYTFYVINFTGDPIEISYKSDMYYEDYVINLLIKG